MNSIYEYIMSHLNEGQEMDEIVKAVTAEINSAKKDYDEIQKQNDKVRKYRIELVREIAASLYDLLNTFDLKFDEEVLEPLTNMSDEDAEECVDLIEKEVRTFLGFKNSLDDLLSALKMDNNNDTLRVEKDKKEKEPVKRDSGSVIADFPDLMNFLTGLK